MGDQIDTIDKNKYFDFFGLPVKKEYFWVFVTLTVLTGIELYVPDLFAASQGIKLSALIFLAVVKAAIVGWSFMHLNFESNWLRFIALIPISAAFYAFVLVLEVSYR
jgi:cytochrome c oxidase subunit IV